MEKKLRVGVIGAGGIATNVHMPSLAEIDNCEVVAICDLRIEKANKLAEKYGVKKTYSIYWDMFQQEEMDAIFVLVNPDCTFRVAADCMKAGYHVLMEKPAGIDAYQANSLVRVSKATGKTAGVAMNRRHIPLIQEVLRRMRATTEIVQIDGRFMKYSENDKDWDYACAFNCDIVHALDCVRYMANSEPVAAATVVGKYNCSIDNAWNSVIQFENGISATLRANYQAAARVHDFEIHGPKASAFINVGFPGKTASATIVYGAGVPMYSAASAGVTTGNIEYLDGIECAGGEAAYYQHYGYKSEDIDFVNAILEGRKPLCTIEDAAKTMDMVELLLKNRIN